MMKHIRVVLDPPKIHNGIENPDPTDYLDFEVEFTSKYQYYGGNCGDSPRSPPPLNTAVNA